MELMKKHGFNELEVETKGDKVKLVKQAATTAVVSGGASMAAPAFATTTSSDAPASAKSGLAAGQSYVRSPFVGTYYESPTPGADPFVQVGTRVNKGQVLCIVEAMKIMNEIEADNAGTILQVLVKNEEPVEFDQPLFVIG